MIRLRSKSGLIPNLTLAVLLISAQFGSLVHAFEHDPGAPQAKYCPDCATASQLSSACVDTNTELALVPGSSGFLAEHGASLVSSTVIFVHQRGPPAAL